MYKIPKEIFTNFIYTLFYMSSVSFYFLLIKVTFAALQTHLTGLLSSRKIDRNLTNEFLD